MNQSFQYNQSRESQSSTNKEVYFTERANWPSISENTAKKASAEVLSESSSINAQLETMKRLYQEVRMFQGKHLKSCL